MLRQLLNILILIFTQLSCFGQIENSTWISNLDERTTILMDIFDETVTLTSFKGWDSINWHLDTIPSKIKKNSVTITLDQIRLKLRHENDSVLTKRLKEKIFYPYRDSKDSIKMKSKRVDSKISFYKIDPDILISSDLMRRRIKNSSLIYNKAQNHTYRLDFIFDNNFILFWTDEAGKPYFQIDMWDIYNSPKGYKVLLTGGPIYIEVNPLISLNDSSIHLYSSYRDGIDEILFEKNKKYYDRDSISNFLVGEWKINLINGDTLNPNSFPPLPLLAENMDSSYIVTNFRYLFNKDLSYTYHHFLSRNTGNWMLSETGDYIILDSQKINDFGDRNKILLIEHIDEERLVVRQYYHGFILGMHDFVTLDFKKVTTHNKR